MDVATLADHLRKTAEHHDSYEWEYPGGGSHRRGSLYGETPKCCSPMISHV
jgi:hypothetical protein